MNIVVPTIVEVSTNKIALRIRVGMDDWTVETQVGFNVRY